MNRWKGALAFLLGVSLFFAGLAAFDGGLHQFAHGGADCENASACAVTMFGAGAVAPSLPETELPAPPDETGEFLFAGVVVFLTACPLGRPSARAPPASILIVD